MGLGGRRGRHLSLIELDARPKRMDDSPAGRRTASLHSILGLVDTSQLDKLDPSAQELFERLTQEASALTGG